VLLTGSLNLQGAQLDLMDNGLIVDYTGASQTTAVAGLVQLGYNSGMWNGPGIISSLAASDPSKAISYVDSAILFGGVGGTFMGVNVDGSATLVNFTLGADSNLDRRVDFADLVNLAQNYNTVGGDWMHGDFNYDGAVDFGDLVALAQNYNKTMVT
jgi:hypothetical protein